MFHLPSRRPALVRHFMTGAMLAGLVSTSFAQTTSPLDRVSVAVGGFYVQPDIQIDADTDFGRIESGKQKANRTTLPNVKAEFLFGERHALALDYLRYDKSYNPTLSGDTVIDGETFSGTASFDGKLRIELAKAAYKWWIVEQNDAFAIGIGAAYYKAKVGGTASATVQGTINGVPTSRTVSGTDATSDDAVAPVIELAWRHAFSPELRMFADASGIKRNGGKVNGHIYAGAVGVEWFPSKNVGLVVDYGIHKIDLRRDSDNDSALRIKLAGPAAYVKARF